MDYKKIYLKPGKEASLLRFHPWIFSGAIRSQEENILEGDIVEVYTNSNEFIAIGHYQIGSIAVRIFSFEQIEINYDFWKNKIQNAYILRQKIGLISATNNCFRLIHGEGDFLSGLIIDIYGDTAVIQAHSVGIHFLRHDFAKIITELLPNITTVFYKSDSTLPFKAHLSDKESYLINNNNSDNIAIENGLKFNIDFIGGQKTGFFIDQHDNRKLLEKYSRGKTVLNMFCYTGGFSVYALRGEAESVVSVDSSDRAIELTKQNINLNFPDNTNHTEHAVDATRFFHDNDEKFDIIILDPPAFAKHLDAVSNALKGYKTLNIRALEHINKGGLLFTFSCSQAISKEQFRLAVFSAAAIAKRNVRILHQLNQPADHPINIYHPEGEYLKGLVLYVE